MDERIEIVTAEFAAWANHHNLTDEQRQELKQLLYRFSEVTAHSVKDAILNALKEGES